MILSYDTELTLETDTMMFDQAQVIHIIPIENMKLNDML